MRTIYKITLALILGLFCIACSDDENDGTQGEPLTLQISNDTIVLNEELADETAVTFSWNKGIDRGAENTIVYIFRLDVFGADFKTSTDPIEIPADGKFEVSYTHNDLNDLILNKWGLLPGDEIKLQARIVAKVNGPKFIYPEISSVELEVKSYALSPKPLFLLGTATAAGLDLTKSIKITEGEIGKFYHWKGNLKVGSFKFTTNQENMLPSINKGTTNSDLVERLKESDPDNMFEVAKEGLYAIALFREEKRIVYSPILYPTMYIIGNATSADWELSKIIEMTWDPTRPNTFVAEIELKAGELKILTEKSYGSPTFRPMKADGALSETKVQVYKDGEDLKWKVNDGEAGTYRITLNTSKPEIKFEKL